MTALDHNQHWAAQRRSWGSSVGAAVNAAPAIVGHKNQSRNITARHVSQTRVPLLALHCPGTLGTFYSICRGDLQTRQRRLRDPLPVGGAATLSRRFTSCRLQFHRIGYQLPGYVSDPFEAHLERLSMRAGCYDRQHSERHLAPCSPIRGKRLPR